MKVRHLHRRSLALLGVVALSLPGAAAGAVTPETSGVISAPETISAGNLTATVSNAFPQVLGYTFAGNKVGGRTQVLDSVLIDNQAYTVKSVQAVKESNTKVAYTVDFNDTDVTMKAEIEVKEITSKAQGTTGAKRPTLTFRITELTGGAHTVEIPGHGLVSVSAKDGGAYAAGITLVSRGASAKNKYAGVADTIESLSESTPVSDADAPSTYLMVNTSKVAVGMETNATYDRPTGWEADDGSRWKRRVVDQDGSKTLLASNGQWTYRSAAATDAVGDEERPYTTLVFTGDANSSGTVNWQDAAVAYADITPWVAGAADNHKWVVTHIPFDFGSAATHPFLQVADDVKRVNLATDGLGQRVMLKGYASEGHDSGHMDYAGNINTRAGGDKDFATLFNTTANSNAIYGVHVNTTEAYPEANSFGSLPFTGGRGWNWLNQSYYVDQRADLGSGAVIKRFQDLRNQFPLATYPNFRWIYIDVYYGSGWQAERLGRELNKMGWEMGSEWADRFERYSTWSHWSNDENYGGATNKGLNSDVIRFVDNSNKDNWNPNVVLGYPQIVEFEGWTGHQDQGAFYRNIWANNLPVKFLQNSRIMRQESAKGENGKTVYTYTFANGTVASGATAVTNQTPATQVAGAIKADMSASRQFVYDGATVLKGDSYLLPWIDNGAKGGAPRLYYYNPAGTATTWTLTKSYQNVGSLSVYRLTDKGRVKVTDVKVEGGKVTIPESVYETVPAAERDHTAFVLAPAKAPAAAATPKWGAGTVFVDPGFNSGSFKGYQTTGQVTAPHDAHGDPIAQLGKGNSSISQEMTLNAGTYQGSAWVQVKDGKTRQVSVSASGEGVTSAASQQRNDDLGATRDKPVTIAFEDFENVPEGWGPFVKGDAGEITDPRTVLASLNGPYTQKGGTLPDGSKKATDDAVAGHWSLKSHEENGGLVYRTVPQTVNFKAGHRYRISYDYENALSGSYYWVTAYDAQGANGLNANYLYSTVMPVATSPTHYVQELNVGGCGSYWVGLYNTQGGQDGNDFTLDNFRVEDLGATTDMPACAAASIDTNETAIEGSTFHMTSSLVNNEPSEITDVTSKLTLPSGWSATADTPATTAKLAKGATFTTTWTVKVPQGAGGSTANVVHTATYKIAGSARSASGDTNVAVLGSVKPDAVNYLSDLPFSPKYNSNGWGPVERDSEVGENQKGDGGPIVMGGKQYTKGLGTHSPADVGFELSGKCKAFKATVGVQEGQSGSVTFRVVGTTDGTNWVDVVPQTGVITSSNTPQEVSGDVTGMKLIRLIVGDGGNGNGNDHANWADARVLCGNATDGDTPAPAPGNPVKDYSGDQQLVSAPAAYASNPASNMFDGNASTFYDKDWQHPVAHPSDIDLALYQGDDPTAASAVSVAGLKINSRVDQANGRPERYEVYVGQDAANINQKVAEGTLQNTGQVQQIVFNSPVKAKLIRLRVLSNYKTKADQPDYLLSIAELGVLVPDGDASGNAAGQSQASAQSQAGTQGQAGTQSQGAGKAAAEGKVSSTDKAAAGAAKSEPEITVNTNAEGLVGQNYLDVKTVNDTNPVKNPSTVINHTWALNWMAADQKHTTNASASYFQRVPVTFNVAKDGTKVKFTVAAGDGDGLVQVDNLRMVKIVRPTSNDLIGVDCLATPTPEVCTTKRANDRIGVTTAVSAETVTPTPTPQPTAPVSPTVAPTQEPTASPEPTVAPTGSPAPTAQPSPAPTGSAVPTVAPTGAPAPTGSAAPTVAPTGTPAPTGSAAPTAQPSRSASSAPLPGRPGKPGKPSHGAAPAKPEKPGGLARTGVASGMLALSALALGGGGMLLRRKRQD